MNLRQLRYFISIVENGSISSASKAVHIAQPVLSLHLKRLEEEFGCELVLRTPRGIVPTEYGIRLARRGKVLLDSASSMRDEVRGLHAEVTGSASIGIPSSLGTILTVPFVQAIRSRFPGIHLRIVEGLSGYMQKCIASGEVDMAVIFGTSPPDFSTTYLTQENLSFLGPKDSPELEGRESVEMDFALDFPLVLPSRPHGVREEAERAALAQRSRLNVIVEVDALEQIKALVASGIAFTMLSERYAYHGPMASKLKILPIVRPAIERTISLAHSRDRPLSIAAQAVREILLEQFRFLETGV